jgi:hypothetical protein
VLVGGPPSPPPATPCRVRRSSRRSPGPGRWPATS